jgi:hypothetical protein
MSNLMHVVITEGWHTLPFEDRAGSPIFASVTRGLFLPPPNPPGTTCGSTESALSLGRSDLRVDSCYAAYGGLTLLTNCVTSQSEIDLIGGAVTQTLALPTPAVATLPTS